MAKGLTIVTLMLLILTLVAFVGFLVRVLFDNTNESIKQQTTMKANEIAGVINLLQASPSGTFHVVDMDKSCLIEIDADSVTVAQSDTVVPTQKLTAVKQSSKAGIIKTALTIEPAMLECKNGAAYVMRCGDTIKIRQRNKPCEP